MGKIIMIASLKGGVGKTTVSASLAYALASLGKKTLAVDMDFGVRSLDIALGHQDSSAPSCLDVMAGKASLGVAVEEDARNKSLFFLSAPMNTDCVYEDAVSDKEFTAFLRAVKCEYDFIVLDMSAGPGRLLNMASKSGEVDTVLIVCTQNTASVRAAEKLASSLAEESGASVRLVINSFVPDRAGKKDYVGIMDIIEHSSVTLLGVVPYDIRVERLITEGSPITQDRHSLAGKALNNIARRLPGETVTLFERTFSQRRRFKLY